MLGLTETKVFQDSPALQHCTPPSHQVFHSARASSRGGGVAIISSKKLACKKFKYPHKVTSFEFLIVHFEGTHKPCFIVNVYRPPNGNFTNFLDEFSALVEHLNTPSRDLLVMGDFNVHVNDHSNSSANRFRSLLNDLGLQNHVKSPTYRHSQHTLDLVIDSYIDSPVRSVEVCPFTSFSDHSLVTFELKCPPFYVKVDKSIHFRLYNDIEPFEQQVRTILDTIEPRNQADLAASLNEVVVSQRDHFFPLLSKIITLSANSPWFDGSCKEAKIKCRRFERRFRKFPSESTKNAYLLALNEYNTILRTTKSEYYVSLFEKLRDNPRKLYATVSIIKGKSPDRILPDLSRTNPLELAFKFNDYLFEKISAIRVELDGFPVTAATAMPLQVQSFLSEFKHISRDEFEDIYQRCNITFCPLDPIDYRKVSPIFLKGYFRDLINLSFESSVFPASEKRGIIYPLLKASDLDYELFSSYRPITNVSYLSKLIETALYEQLMEHVSTNKVLPIRQSAYRKHHSTETALTHLHSELITNIDSNRHTVLISLDLSSAFDSIDHNLLLEELHLIGIRGSALELIRSYLNDRQVQVGIADTISDPLPLRYGAPQGSVLGPLLFSLYTRRLSTILDDLGLSYHNYADDTQIYCSFQDGEVQEVKERITSALSTVKSWMASISASSQSLKDKLHPIFSTVSSRIHEEGIRPSSPW